MLTYYLNPNDSKPLYEQLYEKLKSSIINNDIKTNEKMPSKRMLSNHLKVSLSTVENAYAQLIVEGYIVSIEKKGYFVIYDQSLMILQPTHKIKDELADVKPKEMKKLHVRTNLVDAQAFPLNTWLKLNRKLMDIDLDALINQSDPKGLYELRQEIKVYLKQYRGMDIHANQIVIGAGSEVLLSLISDLIGHQKKVGIEDPGYQKIYHILSRKHHIVPIGLDENGFRIQDPKTSTLDMIHITPSHQFPTGIVMSISRRLELLNWANAHSNRYIIEDDYDSEFRFTGQPIQALYALSNQERVIYINSFSKSLGPSMRLAYMVLPSHLLKVYEEMMGFYHPTIANLTQYTLAYFLKEGYFYKHLNKMKLKYKQKRDFFISKLKQMKTDHPLTILREDAGLHFIAFCESIGAQDLIHQAHKIGLDIQSLKDYVHDPTHIAQDALVIGYAHLSMSDIEKVVLSIEKAIRLCKSNE